MVNATAELFEKDGKYVLTAIGVTTSEVNMVELEALNKYAVNQNIIYRHYHPTEYEDSEIIGTITKSEIIQIKDDNGLVKKAIKWSADLMTYTDYQKKAVGYMKIKQEEGEPIGVSVGKQSFRDDNWEAIDARPFEWSITPYPYCDDCTSEITKMEKDKAMQKIAELEEALTSTASTITTKDTIIAEKDTIISKLESELKLVKDKVKIVEEKTVESSTKKLEANIKAVRDHYENELKTVTDRLEKSEESNKTFSAKLMKMEEDEKRKPYLSTIRKWEKDDWRFENIYSPLPMDKLVETAKKAEAEMSIQPTATPIVQRFEQDEKLAREKAKARIDKYEGLNPTLKKILQNQSISEEEKKSLGGGM